MKPQKNKQLLLEFCKESLSKRRLRIMDDIARIEESLLSEGKSTAGDKHHTGRAMLQLDRENTGRQLLEIEKQETVLGKVNIHRNPSPIALGTWVETTTGHYFVGISAGSTDVEGTKVHCISPATPIGRLLIGKSKGDTLLFQGKEIEILGVF